MNTLRIVFLASFLLLSARLGDSRGTGVCAPGDPCPSISDTYVYAGNDIDDAYFECRYSPSTNHPAAIICDYSVPDGSLTLSRDNNCGQYCCAPGYTSVPTPGKGPGCNVAVNCPAGQYVPPGSNECRDCAPNTYNPYASTFSGHGAAGCRDCPAGSVSDRGSSSCHCAAGYYGAGGSCNACPAGTTSEPGATSCSLCPGNTISSSGSNECTACPFGSTSSPGASTCTQNTAVDICVALGRRAVADPVTGSTTCTCPPGSFTESGQCQPCPPGTNSSSSDSLSCDDCLENTYSGAGATSCTTCDLSSGSSRGSSACTPLPSPRPRARRGPTCPEGHMYCSDHCVDVQTSLVSCGGCVGEGEGRDCSEIRGANDVRCENGRCKVETCLDGYKVSTEGDSCVPNTGVGSKKAKAHGLHRRWSWRSPRAK